MKRALLFLAIAALVLATILETRSAPEAMQSGATITFTSSDPRNPNLIDRDWGARLRNFSNSSSSSEIYVGSGDLSFSGNRKIAETTWIDPPGQDTFTLTYASSPARITMTVGGSPIGSQFYDFQTPVANPNQPFNNLLIQMKSPQGNPEITITNLVLSVNGGSTTSLGTVEATQGSEVFARIGDIGTADTSGFTLTGNIVPKTAFGGSDENPSINFSALFDRTLATPDLTLTKSHAGNFIQGQAGATYTLSAGNIGVGATSGSVTVVDNLPPSLAVTAATGSGWTCSISVNTATCTRTDPLAPGASYPPITLTVNVASTTPAQVVNAAVVTGGNDGNSTNNTALDPTTIIRATDLTIAKTANGGFTQGQSGAGYTLTVTNTGGIAGSGTVSVIDNLPTGLSPATISGPGWSCAISGNTATCTRSDPLAPGTSYPPITVTVNVASNAPPSVTNVATVGGGGDLDAANNTATVVTPIARAPDVTIAKSHTGNFTQGQTATYTVTITNIGAAPTAATVVVADPMFLPLTPRTASGSGWTCDVLTELIRCQRSDALSPGASYPPITMTASIASNAPASILNSATVNGGGDSNASNNSASDTATVVVAADLALSKNHAGNFTQGQSGVYSLTVSNVGGSPTSGAVTIIDEVPAGLSPTTATGTGWTCNIASQGMSCDRNDPLASGQSYPAITLTVGVQRNAPASVTNTGIVFGGGEVNLSNNTATDPTTITAGPNLTITKSHTGNFTQGQTGTYTLTVSNTGGSPSTGAVAMTDSLPSGLASTAATGAGWSCTPGGQSVPCSRSDPVAPGASYPPITLTVEVAANAPASVINTATVAGGSDVDSTNNSTSDPTSIIAVPDLTIGKAHAGSFLQGQVGATYTLTATNIGGGPTTSPVTVSDSLPAGLTPTAAAGAGWVCNIAGQNVSCSRSDALNVGASHPAITLTVNVAPAAPPSLTNTAQVSGGGELNTANSTADDVTTIGPGPDLTIAKTHSGNFTQGQTGATYTITVSNTGSPPTTGVVTATDNVPAGLSPTSATGTGWICSVSGQDVTCTRSDPLASGQSYPPITVTVSVLPGSPESVTNAVTVSGGGDVNPANNSNSDLTTIVPGADLTITKSHAGNFTQAQTGATYIVTVTNSGVGPTTAMVTVTDTFPQGLRPTAATGPGWSCSAGVHAAGCTRSDALAAGASYPPITITLDVTSDAPPVVTNVVGVSGGGDSNAANNSASDPTTITAGADLTVTKTHIGNFTQGQKGASYTITVGNSGGVPTSDLVTAIDVVPAGLAPFAATGTGWACGIIGQGITCGRSDPLSPGAAYPPITVTVDVAPNAAASVTNSARATGGGDVNPANNEVDDVTTIAPGPDLTITKTHAGSFIQGQTGATYTVIVSNQGGAPSSGVVTVNDPMSLPFLPTGAAGSGWTCDLLAGLVQCQRSDVLGPGASYPPMTITVNIDATAPPSATNVASVLGGGDVNGSNNVASDLTAIAAGPDLTLTKVHAGVFTQGRRATPAVGYTLTVQNIGAAPTTGTVTMIDSVPPGIIPVSAGGVGWICSVSPQSVTCTRGDALAPASSYPSVTVTVDIESDAPASVTNTATIAGGGDVNTSNNMASDTTLINTGQNLTIAKSHAGTLAQGQRGVTFTIAVTNIGSAPTLGTVTLIDAVPTGLFATAGNGPGWTCTVSGQTVDCTRGDPLPGGASYPPVTITVDVAGDAPATITNTAIVAGGGDVSSFNNTAEDTAPVATGPNLTIAKTHPRPFGPGQAGVPFILTVSNGGETPTSGQVNVVDDLPVGLTARGATGAGWSCEFSTDTVACSRSDALAAGASYPPITVTADVARDLAVGSTVINRAFVSRGGDITAGNNAAEDVAVLSATLTCDVNGDGTSDLVTGAGPLGGPHVRVLTVVGPSVTELASFYAYDPVFTGGVFVACGDLTGDGFAEVITGAGPGGEPTVRVLNGTGGNVTELVSFFAYDPAFLGGVTVATGDIDGDGTTEIITGAGASGGPHVRVFSVADGSVTERTSFYAYDPDFAGGVTVATGDIDGDGAAEIITGAGASGGPHVRVFSVTGGSVTERASFYAYDPSFEGGVSVAAGDVDGDGKAEVITGPDASASHVRVFAIAGGPIELTGFDAYDQPFLGGVHVATGDLDGDGVAEIITGAGASGGPHVRAFRLADGSPIVVASFYAYDPAFPGGVSVASGR